MQWSGPARLPLQYFVIFTFLPLGYFVIFGSLPLGFFVIFTSLPLGYFCYLYLSPLEYSCHHYLITPGGTLSPLQEQYLPFILHAKLKLACSGDLDPSLVSFIEAALQDEERKALLEVCLYFKGCGLLVFCRIIILMSWHCSTSYKMITIVQTITLTTVTSCSLGYSPVV